MADTRMPPGRTSGRPCGPPWLADRDGWPAAAGRAPFDSRVPRRALSLVVGTIAIAGTVVAQRHQPQARHLDWIGLGLLLVAPLVLATIVVRRQVTATILAVGALFAFLLLDYPWGPVFVPVVAVLATVLLSGSAARSRIIAWSGAAAAIVAVAVANALRDEPAPFVLLFVAAAWSCAALFAAGAARERASRIRLQRRAEDERELAAVTAERLRIARDLHDVLAHSLSAINVQAGVGLHLLDREPEQARAALRSIRETSGQTLDDVREVLGIVRRDPVEGGPDFTAPRWSLARQGSSGRYRPPGAPLTGASAEAVYRVVQEALTNVGRHAERKQAGSTYALCCTRRSWMSSSTPTAAAWMAPPGRFRAAGHA